MLSGNGIRLGKIAGIPIILDFTFFISFVLITALLGTRIFPSMIDPDPSAGTLWALAVAAGVIFFVSLLLHELAHSLVARLYGMEVASITLFLLGGVSQIREEAERPSQEFAIAFVGPLTSALLGGLFLGLYEAFVGRDAPLTALLGWLGFVNLVLAAFNMIPGFPLDGGRVLRALLWALTKSRARATRWSSRVGQAVGILLALYGLASFLNLGLGEQTSVGGLWLVFIGAFLFNAATQSLRGVEADARLAAVQVRDVMSSDLRPVDAETRVNGLSPRRDRVDPHAAFLVTRDDTVLGIVSGALLLLLSDERYASATMEEVMIRADAIVPIAPGATGQEALRRLRLEGAAVLPVVENGRLLGLVGLDQVARALRRSDGARPAG